MHLIADQLRMVSAFISQDLIPILHDRVAKSRFRNRSLVKLHACAAGAEVHVGVANTGNLSQGALVAHRAGGAVHAANFKCCCRHGAYPWPLATTVNLEPRVIMPMAQLKP